MCKEEIDEAAGKQYLPIVWSNIQHNENMRNRLFQFYLGIAGSFLVVLQATETLELSKHARFLCSVFVSVLGFFFLWAFERIREMTNRDNRIVAVINQRLAEGTDLDKMILKEYVDYRNIVATTSLKWWSLTSCFAYSTALIAGVVLASGLEAWLNLGLYFVGLTTIGVTVIYCVAIKALNAFAGVHSAE